MKNVLIIMRRELLQLYTSPIGYIFMIVFLAVSVGLYISTFFAFPVADMRAYFGNLPIILCVFVPAITMRVWAEERKENTWELLLTFPMRASELVLGKFLATFVFFAITLAGSITVPIMLAALGNPDTGAIISGYVGTLLLGAMFLAIGIFFSGFFKDQIVAFVVTGLACFALFLLGTNLIAALINDLFGDASMLAGLGSLLSRLLGVVDHYDAFTRGVVEISDVLYFLVWTGVFLYLNILYVGERHRPNARQMYAVTVSLAAVIGLAFNWLIADMSLGRFDFTEDQIYTVSDATERILSDVEGEVHVNLYISPEEQMPTELKNLEDNITAKLEEIQIASGGKLNVNTIYLTASDLLEAINTQTDQNPMGVALDEVEEETQNDDDTTEEEKIVEERMLEKGIEPFSVQAIAQDAVTNKLVYAHLGIAYKGKPEEIIPRVVPRMLPELEDRRVSTVYKLTLEDAPVIAMVAPKESVNIPEQQKQMMMQMGMDIPQSQDPYRTLEQILRGEKYRVQRVELTKDSPLPDEYDTLVVINPRQLNDRQLWEINRAVHSGTPTFLAIQKYLWDYRVQQRQLNMRVQEENPNINPLIQEYGLAVSDDVLMDANNVPLSISTGNALQDMLGGGQPIDSATHMLINADSMNANMSITSRLNTVFYLWGSPLDIDQSTIDTLELESNILMQTSDGAWTAELNNDIGAAIQEPGDRETKSYPIMAMATGQFPDVYADRDRPAWPQPQPQPGQPPVPPDPADEAPPEPVEAAPGKLVLLGGGALFRDDFVQGTGMGGNLELFMNTVDALALTDDIAHVRANKPINRVIDRPSDEARMFWKFVNYALVPIIVAAIGIIVAVSRVRARNAYTMSQIQKA